MPSSLETARTFKVTADQWTPWSIFGGKDGDSLVGGIMPKILGFLETAMKFRSVVVRPPDNLWGVSDAGGNWSGMIGMLNRSEVDFALGTRRIFLAINRFKKGCFHSSLGPFMATAERYAAIDLSRTIYVDTKSILLPVQRVRDPLALVRPFHWEVWMAILVALPVFLITVAFCEFLYSGTTGSY